MLGLSAAAAFLALALLALLADRLASEPAVGSRASLRAREPETCELTETLDGLRVGQGSRYDVDTDALRVRGLAATVEIPEGGTASLLVSDQPERQVWVRASRNASLPTGVVFTAASSPPVATPSPRAPTLPAHVVVEVSLAGRQVSYVIRDARGRPLDALDVVLEAEWPPAAGIGAGPDGVLVSSMRVDATVPDGGSRSLHLVFGVEALRFDDLDPITVGWFVAALLVFAAWALPRAAVLCCFEPPRWGLDSPVRAAAQLLVVALPLAACVRWSWPFALPVVLLISQSRLVALVFRELARALLGPWGLALGTAAAAGWAAGAVAPAVLDEPLATGAPVRLAPIEGWQTGAIASVWRLPAPSRIHVALDLSLQSGQAALVRWSAEHPGHRYAMFGHKRKHRPGLLLRRVEGGLEASPVGFARVLQTPVVLPLAASAADVTLEIRHTGDQVAVLAGGHEVLSWTALPPSHAFVRVQPLSPLPREPRLSVYPETTAPSPWWAALGAFGWRLAVVVFSLRGLARLAARDRSGRLALFGDGVSRGLLPLVGLLVASLVNAGRGDSDAASFTTWLAATYLFVAGTWIAGRWAFTGGWSWLRASLVAPLVFLGLPACLGLAGPGASTFAYASAHLLPPRYLWAFDRAYEWHGSYGADLRFKGRSHAPGWLPNARRRVVTLGGSQTYGISNVRGAGEHLDGWPELVERRTAGLEVINLALCARHSGDMAALVYGTYELFGARAYVGVFGLNDNAFFDVRSVDVPAAEAPTPSGWRRLLRDVPTPLPMMRLLTFAAASLLPKPQRNDAERRGLLQHNVLVLDRFLRERGARLLLVYEPSMCDLVACTGALRGYDYGTAWWSRADFLQWARTHGIAAVDPVPALRAWRDDFLFFDPIHFTARGHDVMASILASAVDGLAPAVPTGRP